MSNKAVISTDLDRMRLCELIMGVNLDKPMHVEWKPYKPRRSNNANSLYWVWMAELAAKFSVRAKYTADDMHDLMRHQFLGYEPRTIGRTQLKDVLRSTKGLDSAEFCHYMTQIDVWALDKGAMLSRPEDNEYSKYRESQV